MLKNILAKILGKQMGDKLGLSKAKLTAVIYILVLAIQELSKAWGHPIEIPSPIFRFLEAAGLWSIRDAIK